jgi:hypothetical protein
MQESRAVISWEDGSVRSTQWLADDGSQAIVDQMVDAVAAIVNQRIGSRCAIKWERREVRGTGGRTPEADRRPDQARALPAEIA